MVLLLLMWVLMIPGPVRQTEHSFGDGRMTTLSGIVSGDMATCTLMWMWIG